jgi:tryptophan 2,3-dioxygenase
MTDQGTASRTGSPADDPFALAEPVLEGPGLSDYERYLRTDELLALQKGPQEWLHRDELLFTVTHQSAELWLKLAVGEVEHALELIRAHRMPAALRHLRRVQMCLAYISDSMTMLEEMTPWDYQHVRKALGHGSGFDSPGFNALRKVLPQLGGCLQRGLDDAGLSLTDLFVQAEQHEELYQLAEMMIDLDERLMGWRDRHFRVVERTIGFNVRGTQGTPVEVIGGLRDRKFFPDLWDIRSDLSNLADEVL